MFISLYLLVFLGLSYILLSKLLCIIDTSNSSNYISMYLLNQIRYIKNIFQIVLIKASPRFITYLYYKEREIYRVIQKYYSSKVYNMNQVRLIILVVINKRPKVLVNILIYILYLTISLQIDSSRQFNLSTKNIIKLILEDRNKLQSIVRNNSYSRTIVFIYIYNIQVDQFLGIYYI